MKTFKRKILTILILAVAMLGISYSWYIYKFSMSKAASYEVNQIENNNKKILIATQGSKYKNQLTNALVTELKTKNNYIKVIDVSDLAPINAADWDVIVMLHTWEMWRPPLPVKMFIDRVNDKDKLVVHTTSGDGNYKYPDIDAISGASEIIKIDPVKKKLLDKINKP